MTLTSFYYDPARQGYDTTTWWKTLTGTPTLGILPSVEEVSESVGVAEDVATSVT